MMAHLNPGVAVWLCVVVLAPFATVMSQKILPQIPASQEDSPLANLWRHALRNQKNPANPTVRGDQAPKTFVAPDYIMVINWVPQDSAHPLYASEYSDLLREILLDYMVQEEVKPDDPRMSQPNGLQVTNRNGKTLTFRRVVSGGITVNGKKVTKTKTNKDNTFSYILRESLFGHREAVHEVWSKFVKTVPVIDPFGRPLGRLQADSSSDSGPKAAASSDSGPQAASSYPSDSEALSSPSDSEALSASPSDSEALSSPSDSEALSASPSDSKAPSE